MANPIKIVRNVPRSHSDNWDNFCATPEVAVVNDTMMAMLVELIG